MPIKSDKKTSKPGSAHARDAGLVPVQLLVTPEERETIRVAAARAGLRSMAAFARRAVVEAAKNGQ